MYSLTLFLSTANKQGTKSKNRNSLARTSEDSTDSSSSTYSKNDGNGEEGKLDQDIVVTQQQENGSRDKWCPINVVFSFKEYDGDVLIDIVCVVILVPSGTESFSFRVVDDGHVLCFTVYWPSVMKNSKDLHRQFLSQVGSSSIPEYHPRVIAYQEAANRLLNCSDDRLCSSTNICLPSPVLPQIRRSRFMGYRECGSRLYYIDLTAASNDQQVVTKPQLNVEATNESTSRSV